MANGPRYPRINCCIPRCKRGATTFEPGTTMICGKCWRKAPLGLRQRWSKLRRRENAMRKRHHPDADRWGKLADRVFWRIKRLIEGEAPPASMPPLMAEQLRKDGLL
ncbi:MAG: hypothetical protein AAF494_01840 [Pseudomonadota bacterium]